MFVATLSLAFTTGSSINLLADDQTLVELMSVEEEVLLGEEDYIRKVEHSGVYDSPKLSAYIEEIGARLLQAVPLEFGGIEPSFTITNSGVGSAGVMLGGRVYIDRAFLALFNNEAELAGTLAHELGHVAARDVARLRRLDISNPCEATVSSSLDAETIEHIYHQSEYEADVYAVNVLIRAGYDPMALAAVVGDIQVQLEGIERPVGYDEDEDEETCLSTHPPPEDRVSRILEIVGKTELKTFRRNREVYLSKIDGMAWGPNFELILGADEYSKMKAEIGGDLKAYIQIVKVQPGDTFTSLIRKSGVNLFLSGIQFQLLNRLDREAPLTVGTLVKLVR